MGFGFLGNIAKTIGHDVNVVARGNDKPGGGIFGFLDKSVAQPVVNQTAKLANEVRALPAVLTNNQQAAQNTLRPGGGFGHQGGVLGGAELAPGPVFGNVQNVKKAVGTGLTLGTTIAAPGAGVGETLLARGASGALRGAPLGFLATAGQQLESGKFDPKQLALGTAAGAVLGGAPAAIQGGGRLIANIDRSVSNKFPATQNLSVGKVGLSTEAVKPEDVHIQTPAGDVRIAANEMKALQEAKTPEQVRAVIGDALPKPMVDNLAMSISHERSTDPHVISNLISREVSPPSPAPIQDITPTSVRPYSEAAGQGTTKLPVELPKSPSPVQKAFLSVRGELSKAGPSGQEIADKLHATREGSETGQAEFIQKIPTVLDLNKDEFTHFVNSLEAVDKGSSVDVGPKVHQALTEWTQNIQSIRDRAQQAGVDVGDLGPNYFPRNYTELLKSQDGLNRAANHLVETGQADTIGEALQHLQFMKNRYSTPYGHFENSRKLDLPEYDKSKNALVNYISGAYDRISNAEQFGPKGEVARQLIADAGAQGHDISRLLDRYQIATGVKSYNATAEKVTGGVRSFNRFRSLGLSALLNVTQSNNTAAVSGLWRTAGAAFKSFTPAERKYLSDTGVLIDSVLNNLREQTGLSGKVTGKVTAPLFGQVERFNRSVAAVAGKDYASKLASKGDEKSLSILRDKLGVKGDIGSKLTPEQEIQAGRGMVELTQFKVDPQDLPGWVDSPGGKLVAQFRTFGYKQTGFIYNQVLKEAAKGNVLPLARFIALGVPLGVAAGAARNTLRGQPGIGARGKQDNPKDNPLVSWSNTMEGLANVGAFGLGPTDAKFLAQNAGSTRFPEYVAGTTLGPTAGLAVGLTQDIQQSKASNSLKPLERRGLKSLSSVGPALTNKLTPYNGIAKPENQTLSDLKKQGAPQNQIDSYKTFFSVKAPSATSVKKGIDEALLNNDYNKATQLAKDYNAKVEKSYSSWVNKYGDDVPDDLYSRYTGKYINPDGFDARATHLQTPILQR